MSKRVVRVLLIDPNERDYLLIENLLSEIEIFKFKLDWAKTEDEEQAAIANLVCDAYIISDSEQLLARLLPKVSPAPVIVLVNSTQSGIAALSAGAADYLDKNHLSAPLLERSLRLTLTYATDIHRQVKSPEKHRLSEEDYLTTLVEIERQLLNSQNINTCCSNILELLGKASGASRVYLLEIHPDRMGNLSMKQRGEWFAQSAVSEIGKSVVAKVSRRDISTDWIEILSRGELISTTVADLPESERHYFQLLNILSILILPLTLGGKLFGLLGFDNCLEAREWQASEVAFLQAAAGAISLKLERVLAETALGEMEEKLSTIFYRAPVGIAQVALTGKLLMVNQKLCQLLGYTPGELTRLKVQDLTHPDEWGIAIPLTQRMLEEKIESFSYEKRYVRKDGCYIWVNVTVSIVRDSLGEPKYTIKVIEDIQERKEGEEALKRSEKRLRLIADSLPVCISYVDDRWRYRFVNKNYERWFGYKSEDICGKHLAEILGEEAYRLVRGKLERVLAGEQITYEAEIPFQRGGRRYIRATFVPDFDDKFQVKGFYALVADISDRKRAEQQLQYRLTLETALVEVSKEFATNETADVNRILEFLGMAVGASRAYFVRFGESGATGSMTHEWCDSQTEPDIDNFQNMDISVFSWWYEKLNNKQNIIIERVEALPSSAEVEKNYLLSLGVNSVLAVPIYNQSGQLWGQLGFDSSGDNYKHWSEEDSQLLRVVGEMILSYYQRQQAQEKLAASEALYAGIFNHSADGIFLLDILPDGEFVYQTINPAYQMATGLAAKEIVGKSISEVFPPRMAIILTRIYRACVSKGKPISYEKTLELPIGKRIWRTILVPIRDSNGTIVKLQGSSRDITKEKQITAKQLRSSRYQGLLASLTLKIRQSWQIDEILQTAVTELQRTLKADRVLFFRLESDYTGKVVNEATVAGFPTMLHQKINDDCCSRECQAKYREGYIQVCADVFSAGFEPCYREFLQKYQIRANLVLPIIIHLIEAPPKIVELSETTPSGAEQRVWGLLCVQQCSQPRQWTDEEIELLKQLADQLSIALYQAELIEKQNDRRQELARSNAELEQFAYVASHDLQEPLQTIASYAKLLERRYQSQLDTKADKYIHYIVHGAQRMQRQIKDLLEYSRIGKNNQSFQLTDCNEIFKQAIANLQLAIRQHHAVVVSQDLPQLMADPAQLLQLFQNLIANAIKYRRDEPPVVVVKAERQENCWLFSVSDNGIGIDRKYQERIFKIFQRLHGQDEYPGTGIGLAICKKIVKHHGGKIWVDSQPSQGSTFYFTLAEIVV